MKIVEVREKTVSIASEQSWWRFFRSPCRRAVGFPQDNGGLDWLNRISGAIIKCFGLLSILSL